jgi:hypothetical protein
MGKPSNDSNPVAAARFRDSGIAIEVMIYIGGRSTRYDRKICSPLT